MPSSGERNLSVDEAAARLGVAPMTLRAWKRQGLIAHLRLGRRVLFQEADLRAFEEARLVPAVPREEAQRDAQ